MKCKKYSLNRQTKQHNAVYKRWILNEYSQIGWKLKDGKQYINKKKLGLITNKIQDK